MKTLTFVFLVLTITSVMGCSHITKGYPGSSRDSKELARVYGYGVTLREVNGIKVSSNSRGIEVVPGRNEFLLTTNLGNYQMIDSSQAEYYLSIESEAGVTYHVTSQRGSPSICAYQVNELTGKPDFGKSVGCVVRR